MKQKIEWYREVLELEPGSRVFFPLAKFLAADGQTSDAILTLKQGLLRHPDHIEARLFLVELLHLQNAGEDIWKELDGLGGLFASYPGFWQAWSERLSETPALRDASLAMRFFAAALQGRQINWGSVIEQGLFSLLGTAGASDGQAVFSAPELAPYTEPLPRDHAPVVDAAPAAPDSHCEPGAPAEDDESEEVFSLRTRSMAAVLAEQGDVNGALDIYQELIESAPADEKAELAAQAEELRRRITSPPAEEGKKEEKVPSGGTESSRLVSLLESLAQRLEARAR